MTKDLDSDNIDLTTLAEKLTPSDVRELFLIKSSAHMIDLHKDIEEQAYSSEEILSRHTKNQYTQQLLEIGSLAVQLRSIPPILEDECVTYALKHASDNRAIYDRMLARRRLSHGLVSINGEYIGGMPVEGSYHQMMMTNRTEFLKSLNERADKVIGYLEFSGLTQRLIDIFMTWEQVVFNRLNGIEDMNARVKKSMPISQSAPSVG